DHSPLGVRAMPSPAAARASLSVPTTASPAQDVTGARVSVSSPTWSSRCGAPEILSARWGPKTDKVASPCEGATTKSAGPRENAAAAKPAGLMPAPPPTRVSTGPSVSPSTASVTALSGDPTAR
uniref:Uncharacterized protein n=1 Tax=Rhinolophus ferrumequinum TaxID=59479 RepID=A0A671FA54_RHIFE